MMCDEERKQAILTRLNNPETVEMVKGMIGAAKEEEKIYIEYYRYLIKRLGKWLSGDEVFSLMELDDIPPFFSKLLGLILDDTFLTDRQLAGLIPDFKTWYKGDYQ